MIKAALLAPLVEPGHGGVWQFAQCIAAKIGPRLPLHLVLPELALREIETAHALPSSVTTTISDQYIAAVRAGWRYRAFEAQDRGRIGNIRVPLYRRMSRHLCQRFYGGSVEGLSLLHDLKRHKVDVVHVPLQWMQWPPVSRHYPYVINPHDYQHEHLPQYFEPELIEQRRRLWYPVQRAAAAIVVHSRQTEEDAIRYLGVPEERVFYAPYGPANIFPEIDDVTAFDLADKLDLPASYIFYPARMWPHKNHVALIEALDLLRGRGLEIGCVFTDAEGGAGDAVRRTVEDKGLDRLVRIVGRVAAQEMSALYKLCTMVVVPSLFEQNSGPMLEALHFGKAIAVSDLPELVNSIGDGGLVFDRHSPTEMADAIDRVISDTEERAQLERRAKLRAGELSWEPFCETYRQAYRHAAGGSGEV